MSYIKRKIRRICKDYDRKAEKYDESIQNDIDLLYSNGVKLEKKRDDYLDYYGVSSFERI